MTNSVATIEQEADVIAADWCMRLSDDDMTEEEWAQFEAWLEEPGNADRIQQAAEVWQACATVADRPAIIDARAAALDEYRSESLRHDRARRWQRPTWLVGLAASLVVMLGSAYAWQGWHGEPARVYDTGIGERQVAMLDDGSRVSLDAATAVDVRMEAEGRKVELRQGRAKFDVAKDPLRPFTVAVGDKLVVAVGTSFSVELINGDVRVILYEGQVEVRDRDDRAVGAAVAPRVMLTPGAALVDPADDRANIKVSRPDLSNSLNWEQGMVNLDAESLTNAVERMNRYSARKIVLADPTLGSVRVSGMFHTDNVDAFVEGVTTLYPIRERRVGDQIILDRRK